MRQWAGLGKKKGKRGASEHLRLVIDNDKPGKPIMDPEDDVDDPKTWH
jgi:hypothetical protein